MKNIGFHLSKAAFADDFEVVKITGFDPEEEKHTEFSFSLCVILDKTVSNTSALKYLLSVLSQWTSWI